MKKLLFFFGVCFFMVPNCFSQNETDAIKLIDKLKAEKEAKLIEKIKIENNLDLSRKDYDSIIKAIDTRVVQINDQILQLDKEQLKKDIDRLTKNGYTIKKEGSLLQSLNKIKEDKKSLSSTTTRFKSRILNTNFSIPIARFNFLKNDDSKKGDITLFNSIGAGFGISAGEFKVVRDENGEIINEEFTNTFGLHVGFLFSAGSGDDIINVFAPMVTLSLLDFQIGLGRELGTITENQKRTFVTLAYAIPLYKLKKGGYWIWTKATEPINDAKDANIQGGN